MALIVGTAGILFFGLGVCVAARQLIRNRLLLVIDAEGIDVAPNRPTSEKIPWRQVEGFSEVNIHGTKIIAIHVKDAEERIARERNAARRRLMRFNLDYCGAPFGIGTNTASIGHAELWRLLNDTFGKFLATNFPDGTPES